MRPHVAFLQRPCCAVDRAALIQAALSPRSLCIGQVRAPQTCCAAAPRYQHLNHEHLLVSELAVIFVLPHGSTKEIMGDATAWKNESAQTNANPMQPSLLSHTHSITAYPMQPPTTPQHIQCSHQQHPTVMLHHYRVCVTSWPLHMTVAAPHLQGICIHAPGHDFNPRHEQTLYTCFASACGCRMGSL